MDFGEGEGSPFAAMGAVLWRRAAVRLPLRAHTPLPPQRGHPATPRGDEAEGGGKIKL